MAANAGVVINEGFNTVNPVTGLPTGWTQATGAGAESIFLWTQAVDPVGTFPAQSGPANSYVSAGNNSPDFAVSIANYLITPTITINNGTIISFFVKGDPASEAQFPDNLRVLFGAGTNLANFALVAPGADLNPTFSATGIPTDWTLKTFVVSGLNGFVTGRLAFEYVVDNTVNHGDYIGIDTVNVAVVIPEPDSLALGALGLVALGLSLRKSRKQRVLA